MKFLKVAFPIFIIMVFIFIMNAAFLFHPLIDSVPERIDSIEDSIIHGDWEKANDTTNALIKDVKKNKLSWMQYSIEREELNNLLLNMYQLKGSILIMDTPSAMISLYGLKANWSNLGG